MDKVEKTVLGIAAVVTAVVVIAITDCVKDWQHEMRACITQSERVDQTMACIN